MTGADGKWTLLLDPMTVSSVPRKMTVASQVSGLRFHLSNILVGDVWVLTGQSNMAREFRTYSWLMEELPKLEENEHIRWFKIQPNTACDEPSKEVVIDPVTELKGSGRTGGPLPSQTVVIDVEWHRICLVWDGSYRILYVDGTEVAKDTQAQAYLEGVNGGLYLGTGSTLDATGFFSGLIDDLHIYDWAITP